MQMCAFAQTIDKNFKENSGAGENVKIRITAFDHVRGLAVIFMILSHVMLVFGSETARKSIIGRFMEDGLGTAPAAPVFMILLGIFFCYPSAKPTVLTIGRGMRIYLLGILLNVFRIVIPLTIAFFFLKEMVQPFLSGHYNNNLFQTYWEMTLALDILQFAGLSFIIMAVIEKFIQNKWAWAAIGVIAVIAAPLLWGSGENAGFIYEIIQPLWGNSLSPGLHGDTAFPVFPWIAYPLAGAFIGKSMAEGKDIADILKWMVASGSVLFLGGGAIVLYGSFKALGDYYRMYPAGNAFVLGFALLWISFFIWLFRKNLLQGPLNRLIYWSENLTLIYVIQWVLLGFSMLIFGIQSNDNPWLSVILSPVYIVLTYIVCRLLKKSESFMTKFRWFTK